MLARPLLRAGVPILALALLLVAAAASAEASDERPPNVVLVFIDDMGWADLSCFGNEDARTPEIDRLAAEGLAFEQFYVNSPICSPSRVAISTGQYPQRWGISSFLDARKRNVQRGMAQWLDPKAPMLARSLQAAGYATGHFGKWHMGGQRDVDDAPAITEYGFDRSLTNFEGMGPKLLPMVQKPGEEQPGRIWTDAERLGGPAEWRMRSTITGGFVEAALDFMREAEAADRPFYVNVWPDDVHSPFFPSLEHWAASKRDRYRAVLQEMDRQLGPLFAWLRAEPERRERTLVLLCSDNGHEPGAGQAGPLFGSKACLYEGGIRSPLVVWAPGLMAEGKAGTRNTESFFSAIDLVPSLLRLCGAEGPEGVRYDGEDVADTLLGRSTASREAPLCFGRPPDRKSHGGLKNLPDLAVRHGRWKLLCDEDGGRAQLFDIPSDPGETEEQGDEQPELRDRLREAALAWHAEMTRFEREQMALDYQAFDQTLGAGWRLLADAGHYLQAARLIEIYMEKRPGLNLRQRLNLNFHCGQMYAFGGIPGMAVRRFHDSLRPDEPADAPLRWNAYVKASIAFLQQDEQTLRAMRAEIAAGPRQPDGSVPNLDVVDRLIRHLGESYAEAYRARD